MRGKEEIKKTIEEGKAVLGIEFGSTRTMSGHTAWRKSRMVFRDVIRIL